MSIRGKTTSGLSHRRGGEGGAVMAMVILGAAAACVSVPSATSFLINNLNRRQNSPIKKDKKLKMDTTPPSTTTSQVQLEADAPASHPSDASKDKDNSNHIVHHQEKMYDGEIEPVIDSPEPCQQQPTVSDLTPEEGNTNNDGEKLDDDGMESVMMEVHEMKSKVIDCVEDALYCLRNSFAESQLDTTDTITASQQQEAAAQEMALRSTAIADAVNMDHMTDNKKNTEGELARYDDELEAMMSTTLRTLAKLSPTTTTGSLSVDSKNDDDAIGGDEVVLSAAAAPPPPPSLWYTAMKMMQLLLVVVFKIMVVFTLLAVSLNISERYEIWPRVMDVPPPFWIWTTSQGGDVGNVCDGGGDCGNGQRCDEDDVLCLVLKKHGF